MWQRLKVVFHFVWSGIDSPAFLAAVSTMTAGTQAGPAIVALLAFVQKLDDVPQVSGSSGTPG